MKRTLFGRGVTSVGFSGDLQQSTVDPLFSGVRFLGTSVSGSTAAGDPSPMGAGTPEWLGTPPNRGPGSWCSFPSSEVIRWPRTKFPETQVRWKRRSGAVGLTVRTDGVVSSYRRTS